MKNKRWQISSNLVVLVFSIYALIVFNLHFWQFLGTHAPITENHNWLLWVTMPFFMLAAMSFCIQLLFWPWLHKVMVPLLLLVGAGTSYAVMTQNIYFNTDMIQNIMQTNRAEASAWITPGFLGWIALTGILPAALYLWKVRITYTRPWYKECGWRLAGIAIPVAVTALIAAMAYSNYAAFFRNNKTINHQITPTNILGSVIKTAYNAHDAGRPLVRIGLDAKQAPTATKTPKRVFILVMGETTRAESWGLNGYQHQTTPQLAAMGTDIINFPQVSSCGTATAVSVPCLFSNMPRTQYDANLAAHQEGLMDVLQRAKLYTSWRENDGGCKGACDRIKHINISNSAHQEECADGCLDMKLLTGLKQEIQQMPNNGVIVLHTMGSHGPAYYQRYTPEFKRFTPTCDTNQIQRCSDQQLHNTYDNTIVYIDNMLAQTIHILQSEQNIDAALWYFSDHGESLGENGIYLHATPYAIAPSQQTHIPMIFWANNGFYQHTGLNKACLAKAAAKNKYSHDNVFHSMLGIMDVQTKEYHKDLDLFQPCRS